MKYIFFLLILLLPLSGCNFNRQNQTIMVTNGTIYQTNDSLKENGPLTTNLCPSTGDVKLLAFLVSFDDLDYTKEKMDVEACFNAPNLDNGYYSVNSYYATSSYQKLNLTADVIGLYKAKYPANYYEAYNKNSETGSDILAKEVLTYYNDSINYEDYDSDNDGYVDGIWLIYTNPVDYMLGDFWWAYTSVNELDLKLDDMKFGNYAFAGIDFLYDKTHNSYDATNIIVDAHTFIHETGHMLGLDDYYDVNPNVGARCSLQGIDMMDETCGDQGPISKLLLGWINPIIINSDCEYELAPFETSGEVLLISKTFKGTLYDSYYLVINYGNLEINLVDKVLNGTGIIVYEVNAEQNKLGNLTLYNGGSYDTAFKYDNSDTSIPFVNIITKSNFQIGISKESNILFKKGDTLSKTSVDFSLDVLYNSSSNLDVKIVF